MKMFKIIKVYPQSLPDTKTKQRKKQYSNITDELRLELFNLRCQQKVTLKEATKQLGIKYSSGKNILHNFRKSKRLFKKTKRSKVNRNGLKAVSSSISTNDIIDRILSLTSSKVSLLQEIYSIEWMIVQLREILRLQVCDDIEKDCGQVGSVGGSTELDLVDVAFLNDF